MSQEEERDRLLAHFYDLEYRDYTDDVDFSVQYALGMDPDRTLPLLELGCGTGRLSLALARAGFHVVGVDLSPGMAEIARGRVRDAEPVERVEVVVGDMRDLASAGVPRWPYNLAFCALNTFAYLQTTEEQLAMLAGVRDLLVQHGILILDLTPPRQDLLPPSNGEMVYQGRFEGDGETLHKTLTGVEEPSAQLHHVTILYDLESADGTLRRTTQALTMRWTGRFEMELLLRVAGFRLEKVYGSYELDDYGDDSERMIFVARP